MSDRDDRLLSEAYNQVNEGIFDRMKASKGTVGKNLGTKAMGAVGRGISKFGNQDTRMGKFVAKAGQGVQDAASEGQEDVKEQRAAQLIGSYSGKVSALYDGMKQDAQKVGLNLDQMAQQDMQKTGQYPALEGLSVFLKDFNNSIRALQELTKIAQASGQQAPAEAPAAAPAEAPTQGVGQFPGGKGTPGAQGA